MNTNLPQPGTRRPSNQAVDLIYQEFLLRFQLGDNPNPTEYIDRHPEFGDELRRQFQLREALQSDCQLNALDDSAHVLDSEQTRSRRPTQSAAETSLVENVPERTGTVDGEAPASIEIDGYRILREIGRGSSGVVYEAEQVAVRRSVALKILSRAHSGDPRRLHRFQLEARVAASLHRDGVVPIFDIGEHQGCPYYSMLLIPGPNLEDVISYFRDKDVTVLSNENVAMIERYFGDTQHMARYCAIAELGRDMAIVLEHAHRVGIVHRDVKPANYVLAANGTAWLTDFGLAQLEGQPTGTCTGDMLGTPMYMSPERLIDGCRYVDARADIYSLGATLYELLTHRTPFPRCSFPELLRQIAEKEPPNCRDINPFVPRDLETVVTKAMAKLPSDRYESADLLADDLARFLRGETVRARRLTSLERMSRRLKKHLRAVALTISFFLLLTFSALTVTSFYVSRLSTANLKLAASQSETQQLLYAAEMNLAFEAMHAGQAKELERILDRHIPRDGEVDFRGIEWHILRKSIAIPNAMLLRGHVGAVYELALVPNRPWVVSAGEDRRMRVWDITSGSLVRILETAGGPLYAVAVSPDGRYVAAGHHEVAIWDLGTGQQTRVLQAGLPSSVESLAFSHDGQQLAMGCRYEKIVVVSVADGAVVCERIDGARHEDIGFSADGQSILCHAWGGQCDILRKWNGNLQSVAMDYKTPNFPLSGPRNFAFMRGEQWIAAVGEYDPRLSIFDAASGELLKISRWGGNAAKSLAVSADSEVVAVGRINGLIDYFYSGKVNPSASAGQEFGLDTSCTVSAHHEVVFSLVACADGRFVSAGADGVVRVAPPPEAHAHQRDEHEGMRLPYICQNPVTGQLTAIAGSDALMQLWMESGAGQWSCCSTAPSNLRNFTFSGDGRRLWMILENGDVAVSPSLSPDNYQLVPGMERTLSHCIAISPDDAWGVLCFHERIDVYKLPEWQRKASFNMNGDSNCVQFASDSKRFACSEGYNIHVVNLNETWANTICRGDSTPIRVAWHGDDLLASGHSGGEICLWDATTLQRIRTLRGHDGATGPLTFSADGRTLVSLGSDASVRLWQVATGQPLGVLFSPPRVHGIDNSLQGQPDTCSLILKPDGKGLVCGLMSTNYDEIYRWSW